MGSLRKIRALYNDKTIRVYQAYNDEIADSVIGNGTFKSPPFKMERMTWIKPSFLWMMYRCGWGEKDRGQNRILGIDISREGFKWALENSVLSHKANDYTDKKEWLKIKNATPVRIQWDPERDIYLQPLKHRSIQIGLTDEAVPLYVNQWIQNITDITDSVKTIHRLIQDNQLEAAKKLLPVEQYYPVSTGIEEKIDIKI